MAINETYHEVVTYHPASATGPSRWELALFGLATVLLFGYAFHRIRRFPG